MTSRRTFPWGDLTREDSLKTSINGVKLNLEASREDANFWRHVAMILAGGDKSKINAAGDAVCEYFDELGRKKIGPVMNLKRVQEIKDELS